MRGGWMPALALAVAGCSNGGSGSVEGGAGSTQPASSFELRPVVAPAIAALERELADQGEQPNDPPLDELTEQVRGLASMITQSAGSMRNVALEEARTLDARAAGILREIVVDENAPDEERGAAIELLGAMDSVHSAGVLLALLEESETAWIRTHAAWRLGSTSQDWVVPRTLLRLKYEKDHDAVVWIANALAHFGNYSGVGVLLTVWRESPEQPLRDSAAARLATIAEGAGFDDALGLWSAWRAGDPDGRFAPRERSKRYELEVWRRIARFDEFQLRGVDDSRYVLEGLGAAAASLFARALHEEDVYVRVHVGQGLARMGPRGVGAGDELVPALDDPALGPTAAVALGSVRHGPGEAALRALLDPGTNVELRLAAARALGGYGEGAAEETANGLRALTAEGEAPELRQAATESLLALGHASEAVPFLLECLSSPTMEPATSERALRAWLARLVEAGNETAGATLADWDELEVPNLSFPDAETKRRSRVERRELVEAALAELVVE